MFGIDKVVVVRDKLGEQELVVDASRNYGKTLEQVQKDIVLSKQLHTNLVKDINLVIFNYPTEGTEAYLVKYAFNINNKDFINSFKCYNLKDIPNELYNNILKTLSEMMHEDLLTSIDESTKDFLSKRL